MKPLLIVFQLLVIQQVAAQTSGGVKEVFTNVPDTLFVEKERCDCHAAGYKLSIRESTNLPRSRECEDYTYDLLYTAKYQHKVALIKQLLTYAKDTSLACGQVVCYATKSVKYSESVISKRYTLQISALFHINLICFAQHSVNRYAPFPVLVNMSTGAEFNYDQKKIQEVVQIYESWFIETEKSGFTNYRFPLANTNYQWKFGDYSEVKIFDSLTFIRSDYMRRLGNPVRSMKNQKRG